MAKKGADRRMIRNNLDNLEAWINAFIRDVKTRGLSVFTHDFYSRELAFFLEYCGGQGVTDVSQVTADTLRGFLTWLQTDRKRNDGGKHAGYRAIRAFMLWWEREAEPDDWQNPIKKIRMTKQKTPPIPGVPAGDVAAMLATCQDNFTGWRDRALLLCLLDTGARAREFLALNVDDIDLVSGAVTIRKGKGNKARTVFVGKKSRRALRAYLKRRADNCPALWVTRNGGRLAVSSLRNVLERRAKAAGVPTASSHDFRRSFAVNMLRAGCDVFTLQKLMGHESLDVLTRYLALVTDDIQRAHERGSPVDNLL